MFGVKQYCVKKHFGLKIWALNIGCYCRAVPHWPRPTKLLQLNRYLPGTIPTTPLHLFILVLMHQGNYILRKKSDAVFKDPLLHLRIYSFFFNYWRQIDLGITKFKIPFLKNLKIFEECFEICHFLKKFPKKSKIFDPKKQPLNDLEGFAPNCPY